MPAVIPGFFETNTYFIDEKVAFFKFTNAYKVYDEHGNEIGLIKQKLSAGQKAMRLILNKAMLPFHLDIMDLNGNVLVSIKRGWTFWMSKTTIIDGHGQIIAFINQKFKLIKPAFKILDPLKNEIAHISGDWKGWNFSIKDPQQREIGSITKKWNGILKEAFTTADKYVVNVVPEYAEDHKKMAIVSCAATIDMVLKESK